MLPQNTAQILRDHGLKVVETPGYKTRGRPASTGGFNPVGVLCHHTATNIKTLVAAVLRLLIGGRSDLPGPLCHFGLGRDGTVYLIALGRANHAGKARASGTVSAGDGNELYVGIEAFNDGLGEPWPRAQYEAYVLLCAIICVYITKNSANTVRAHRETSVTGKPDPKGIDMDQFRARVAVKMTELENGSVHDRNDTTESRGEWVDKAISDLQKAQGKGPRLKNIQAAIATLKLIKPVERNKTT